MIAGGKHTLIYAPTRRVYDKFQATSKNSFLMIWARDLGPTKVSKSSEYFVYWGLFEMNCWGKRSDQIAKGEFLEVP